MRRCVQMSHPLQPLPLNHIRIINEPNSLSWVYKPVLNSRNNDSEFYVRTHVCVAWPIFNNDNIQFEIKVTEHVFHKDLSPQLLPLLYCLTFFLLLTTHEFMCDKLACWSPGPCLAAPPSLHVPGCPLGFLVFGCGWYASGATFKHKREPHQAPRLTAERVILSSRVGPTSLQRFLTAARCSCDLSHLIPEKGKNSWGCLLQLVQPASVIL